MKKLVDVSDFWLRIKREFESATLSKDFQQPTRSCTYINIPSPSRSTHNKAIGEIARGRLYNDVIPLNK